MDQIRTGRIFWPTVQRVHWLIYWRMQANENRSIPHSSQRRHRTCQLWSNTKCAATLHASPWERTKQSSRTRCHWKNKSFYPMAPSHGSSAQERNSRHPDMRRLHKTQQTCDQAYKPTANSLGNGPKSAHRNWTLRSFWCPKRIPPNTTRWRKQGPDSFHDTVWSVQIQKTCLWPKLGRWRVYSQLWKCHRWSNRRSASNRRYLDQRRNIGRTNPKYKKVFPRMPKKWHHFEPQESAMGSVRRALWRIPPQSKRI